MNKATQQMQCIKVLTELLQADMETHERDRSAYMKDKPWSSNRYSHTMCDSKVKVTHIKSDIRRLRRELMRLYKIIEKEQEQ